MGHRVLADSTRIHHDGLAKEEVGERLERITGTLSALVALGGERPCLA